MWRFVSLLGLGILVRILLFQRLNHRRRLSELRFKTLETLAWQGVLDQAQLRELLEPKPFLLPWILVGSWIGFVTGLGLLLASTGPGTSFELFEPGIYPTLICVALLSAPTMLRELRNQEAL